MTERSPPFSRPSLLLLFSVSVRHDQLLILASPNARFSPIVLHHHAPSITSAACNGLVRDSYTQTTQHRQVSQPCCPPIDSSPPDQSKASPLPRPTALLSIPSSQTSPPSFKLQASYFLFCLVSFVWLRIPSLDIKIPDIDTRCCLLFACGTEPSRHQAITTSNATHWRDTPLPSRDRSRRRFDGTVHCPLATFSLRAKPNRDARSTHPQWVGGRLRSRPSRMIATAQCTSCAAPQLVKPS